MRIKPPKRTTSDYYHNKAMDIRCELRKLNKEIKQLTEKLVAMQLEYDSLISARNNSRKYE